MRRAPPLPNPARPPATMYFIASLVVFLGTCVAILVALSLGYARLHEQEELARQYHLPSSVHAAYLRRQFDDIEHLFTTAHTHDSSLPAMNFLRNSFDRSASTIRLELATLRAIQAKFGHPEPGRALDRLNTDLDPFLDDFFSTLDDDRLLNEQFHMTLHALQMRIDQFDRLHFNAYRETDLVALRAGLSRRFLSFTAIVCGSGALLIGVLIRRLRSARRSQERATDEAEERRRQLDALFLNAPLGLLLIDENLCCVRGNAFIASLRTRRGPSVRGASLKSLLQTDDDDLERSARRVLRTGIPKVNLEMRCRFDPDRRSSTPVSVSLFPIDTKPGRPKLIGCIVEDITERTQTAERQKLMMRELDHRVKNNLAAVLGLAQQSIALSDSLDEFSASFLGRITAMARTHEALAQSNWEGVDLATAADITLMSHLPSSRPRVMIEGKSVRLPSRAAMPICLTLHELATNSTKYGSLSMADGHVDLTWSREGDHLDIRWYEQGGPPVQEPITPGYGMKLIEGLVCHQLAGEVSFGADQNCYRCVIRIPLSEADDDATINPAPDV